jgi:hypothetical protein
MRELSSLKYEAVKYREDTNGEDVTLTTIDRGDARNGNRPDVDQRVS